jgi:hypothetical protein
MARGREQLAASNGAVFLWGFAVCFTAMVAAFTWLFIVKGPPGQFHPVLEWAILGVFWLGAVGLATHALAAYRGRVEWDGARAWLVVAGPFSRSERAFGGADVRSLAIVQGADGDGDPWYQLMLTLRDGEPVEVAAGSDRPTLEQDEARIRQALRLPAGGAGLS